MGASPPNVVQLTIDLGACIRSGECYYNHPELIRRTDSGDPELIVTDLTTAEQQQHAQEAAEVCPAQAIRVSDLPSESPPESPPGISP